MRLRHVMLFAAGVFCCVALPAGADAGTIRLRVAADGSGEFRSIQEALRTLDPGDTTPVVINVKNGLYQEQVFLQRSHVTLLGEDMERTRIVFPVLREAWRAAHGGSDWGAGVVNIDTGVSDITLANLTVLNNSGSLYGGHNTHQFAIRGAGTRIILLHCAVLSDGGDALSLWDRTTGMYYHAYCVFAGWVDMVCPRGWCYITNSAFFGHDTHSAVLWHDGSGDRHQKFVIASSSFDGRAGFPLGRNHRDGQVILLDCHFSANLADKPFFRPASSPAPWRWGDRHYYSNCHRDGGDYPWFADNLNQAEGSPRPAEINAEWTFDGKWNPEANLPAVLPFAAFPNPPQFGRITAAGPVVLHWKPGIDATSHCIYFGGEDSLNLVSVQAGDSVTVTHIDHGKTYRWRVDEIAGRDTVRGEVWSFTVMQKP